MADRTEKIENEHADEQIEVSGSEIESRSDAQEDEFAEKQSMEKSNVKLGSYENNKVAAEGGYQASDYTHLAVSQYTPVMVDIDSKLKAFVPDYIPAIGEVDAFLKMPRPDGKPETLGLNVVDEPALNQSDKAKIHLMIRNNNNQYVENPNIKVHSIQEAEKNPKQVLEWVNSVGDIHKNKQPPTVSYSKRMPDIDSLMQVWPQEVEDMFSEMNTPSEEIDLSLEEYCKIACNILDIPVHKEGDNNVIESLHVMFTLFSAFKENQHFQQENESFAHGV